MSEILAQTVGVDVSLKTLDICFGQIDKERDVELLKPFSVPNNMAGFKQLIKKIERFSLDDINLYVVMEATGVYHENLAYYMYNQSINVSIVLPNLMNSYMKSLSLKQLDDNICARAIAKFGLERKLELWVAPDPSFRVLRQLTRERSQIVEERTIVKNRLHADESMAYPIESSITRLKKRIAFLDKQEQQINAEIKELASQNEAIKSNVDIIESIPGMGFLSAVTILAETSNFDLIKNKKQLTSYAGLDVVHKTSGTSVNSKNRISKKGNKHLRKVLHFPALTAIKHNETFKDVFIRITARTGLKMKGAVAIQRKMLELSYSLVKKNQHFIKDYEKSRAQNNPGPTQDRINLPLMV